MITTNNNDFSCDTCCVRMARIIRLIIATLGICLVYWIEEAYAIPSDMSLTCDARNAYDNCTWVGENVTHKCLANYTITVEGKVRGDQPAVWRKTHVFPMFMRNDSFKDACLLELASHKGPYILATQDFLDYTETLRPLLKIGNNEYFAVGSSPLCSRYLDFEQRRVGKRFVIPIQPEDKDHGALIIDFGINKTGFLGFGQMSGFHPSITRLYAPDNSRAFYHALNVCQDSTMPADCLIKLSLDIAFSEGLRDAMLIRARQWVKTPLGMLQQSIHELLSDIQSEWASGKSMQWKTLGQHLAMRGTNIVRNHFNQYREFLLALSALAGKTYEAYLKPAGHGTSKFLAALMFWRKAETMTYQGLDLGTRIDMNMMPFYYFLDSCQRFLWWLIQPTPRKCIGVFILLACFIKVHLAPVRNDNEHPRYWRPFAVGYGGIIILPLAWITFYTNSWILLICLAVIYFVFNVAFNGNWQQLFNVIKYFALDQHDYLRECATSSGNIVLNACLCSNEPRLEPLLGEDDEEEQIDDHPPPNDAVHAPLAQENPAAAAAAGQAGAEAADAFHYVPGQDAAAEGGAQAQGVVAVPAAGAPGGVELEPVHGQPAQHGGAQAGQVNAANADELARALGLGAVEGRGPIGRRLARRIRRNLRREAWLHQVQINLPMAELDQESYRQLYRVLPHGDPTDERTVDQFRQLLASRLHFEWREDVDGGGALTLRVHASLNQFRRPRNMLPRGYAVGAERQLHEGAWMSIENTLPCSCGFDAVLAADGAIFNTRYSMENWIRQTAKNCADLVNSWLAFEEERGPGEGRVRVIQPERMKEILCAWTRDRNHASNCNPIMLVAFCLLYGKNIELTLDADGFHGIVRIQGGAANAAADWLPLKLKDGHFYVKASDSVTFAITEGQPGIGPNKNVEEQALSFGGKNKKEVKTRIDLSKDQQKSKPINRRVPARTINQTNREGRYNLLFFDPVEAAKGRAVQVLGKERDGHLNWRFLNLFPYRNRNGLKNRFQNEKDMIKGLGKFHPRIYLTHPNYQAFKSLESGDPRLDDDEVFRKTFGCRRVPAGPGSHQPKASRLPGLPRVLNPIRKLIESIMPTALWERHAILDTLSRYVRSHRPNYMSIALDGRGFLERALLGDEPVLERARLRLSQLDRYTGELDPAPTEWPEPPWLRGKEPRQALSFGRQPLSFGAEPDVRGVYNMGEKIDVHWRDVVFTGPLAHERYTVPIELVHHIERAFSWDTPDSVLEAAIRRTSRFNITDEQMARSVAPVMAVVKHHWREARSLSKRAGRSFFGLAAILLICLI